MLRVTILLLCVAFLGGCSALRTIAEKYEAPEKVAKAVDRYCVEIPYVERVKTRESVNSLTTVGDISIVCAGDPQ